MRLLNLTPHAIVILNSNGEVITTIPASGKIARIKTSSSEVGTFSFNNESIPVIANTKEGFIDLPNPSSISEEYDGILVSSMVLDCLPAEYHNIAFAPDTGPSAVRDSKGHIVGVTQLRTI